MALVQVMPEDDAWKVVVDGVQEGAPYGTQDEAQEVGRMTAKALGAEFQLHGRGGEVRAKDSYGNDPRGIPG